MFRMLLGAFTVALMATCAHGAETVKIDTGTLKGATSEGVTSFKGIPYARPPVGPLRWRAPLKPAKWDGVRDAGHYGALCMQVYNAKDNGVGPLPMSEDCLTLNVFVPEGAKHLPVMFWIHGGGLVNGSATADLYDGTHLAQQGVIVVSLNYRLGRLGFFAHPALSAEAQGEPTANYGLMDQIAALEWVKRNVSAFGGDPSNVTVFGESAGGASVNRLMMIPVAETLFKKAIVESGVGREQGQSLKQAEAQGRVFADRLRIVDQTAAALRAVPAQVLLDQGDPSMTKGELPIIDGHLLREGSLAAFRAGHQAKVPYLVGSNSQEIPPAFARGFGVTLPDPTPDTIAAFGSKEAFDDYVATDVVFGEPARAMAKAQAEFGAPTWLYRFSVVSLAAPKAFKGAIHASDRQYVFDTLKDSPWPTDARDEQQAKIISAYWVAFAKTGDPNGGGRPLWPRYDNNDRLVDFTNDGPQVMKTPDARALDFLAQVADKPTR